MLVYKEIIASVVILASGETVLVDNSCMNILPVVLSIYTAYSAVAIPLMYCTCCTPR